MQLLPAMDKTIAEWRAETGTSLKLVADACGVSVSTALRWESGESLMDADALDRLFALSDGAITAGAMQSVRLAWLKEHRPDKFTAQPQESAA